MGHRFFYGILIIAVLGGAVLGDRALERPIIGSVLALAMTLAAQRELFRIVLGRVPPAERLVAAVTIAVFSIQLFGWGDESPPGPVGYLLAILIGGQILAMIVSTFRMQAGRQTDDPEHLQDALGAALALLYVVAPVALLQRLMVEEGGQGTLIAGALVMISKCGDIGGYIAGTLFGKHRVMPRVSPKKSWEGSTAGLLLTIGAAYLFASLEPRLSFGLEGLETLVFAIVINIATQFGDFAESMLKRAGGVKDSALIVPTFGGALDIIDSLLFAVPAATLVFWLAA